VITICAILIFALVCTNTFGIKLATYIILLELLFFFLFRVINYLKQGQKENHQQKIVTSGVFPVFRLDIENFQMVQAHNSLLVNFLTLIIIIFWSMLIGLLFVEAYYFEIIAMCFAISLGAIYLAELMFRSKWMEDISELESLNAKDLYTCLRQTVLSSMLGMIPSSNGGDIDIESLAIFLNKLFDQNENIEAWKALRKAQCKELRCCTGFNTETLSLNEISDSQLLRVAMNIVAFNGELKDDPPNYLSQLNNLLLIDKTIQERLFMKAKRVAFFIAQLRLIMKTKKLQSNGMRVKKQIHKSMSMNVSTSKLCCIPQSVKYEAGTHIELDLIGASIFMPWKWVRAKDVHPKTASICVFSANLIYDQR